MKVISLFFTSILLMNCNEKRNKPLVTNKPKPLITIKQNSQNYIHTKNNINSLKIQLATYATTNNSSIEAAFTSVLIDSIIPFWYGTNWNFNGNTSNPKNGSIACGYFVSTTLQHTGLLINRIKIGQAPSSKIINEFALKKDTKLFLNKPNEVIDSFCKKKGKGVYIIGLDSHVGFVYFDGATNWFIHSKWYKEKAVVKEVLLYSSIIRRSKYKLIGKISSNKNLLQMWLQTKVPCKNKARTDKAT